MFNWHNPYPTTRTPVFARNLVSTSQPLAAQAGLQVLRNGGNAVDAAIAAAAVITMTEPCSNGLGADNFAIVWDGRQLHGLNASGISPAAWTLDYFRSKYGADVAHKRPTRGIDTVTVPGCVAGWRLLHDRFGQASFGDCLAPAIEYGERGFAVSRDRAGQVDARRRRSSANRRAGPRHFLPKGRVPHVGEHFVLQGAAQTLQRIAESKGEDYYRGEIAAAIAQCTRRATRRADGEGPRRLLGLACSRHGWVGTVSQGLPRLHSARDPAERPGHRGADRARHPRAHAVSPTTRSTAPTGSTTASRR